MDTELLTVGGPSGTVVFVRDNNKKGSPSRHVLRTSRTGDLTILRVYLCRQCVARMQLSHRFNNCTANQFPFTAQNKSELGLLDYVSPMWHA